jgi:hypothetical protein
VADLLNGYQRTCAIVAAQRVGLFEALASGPTDAETLAERLEVRLDALSRLLAALSALGLICCQERVSLTDDGAFLLLDSGALGELALLIGAEYLDSWSRLDLSLRSGSPAFPQRFGMTAWEHRQAEPEVGEAFDRFTSGAVAHQVGRLVDLHDFSAYRHVVDVGGGRGYLLAEILQRHPASRATLVDLPSVVSRAGSLLQHAGVADRCSLAGLSFFESELPRGGDLYVLKHVLHDWDDGACLRILKGCRAAMAAGARLLIAEQILPEAEPPALSTTLLDLHMMVVLGGRERRLCELCELLRQAGFALERRITTPADLPDLLLARAESTTEAHDD